MAFASSIFRRVISAGGSSTATSLQQQWRLAPSRLCSTTPTPTPTASPTVVITTPKLFVSGLSRLTTDEKLKQTFSPFGQLLEAKVITDRASGRSKGFAFVRYATIEEAQRARDEMNAKFLDGWVIFVDPAKPREARPPPPQPPQPESEQQELGFRTNKTIGWCG